jgi:hypothetical protein
VENNFVGHSFAEKLQLRGQQSAQHWVGVNVQRQLTSQKAERRNHSYEAEAVVAVQMGDEYVVDACKVLVRLSYLQLSALAAIYHKEFVAYPDYLRA